MPEDAISKIMSFRNGIVIWLFVASTVWAQSSRVGGAMEGAVTDSTHSPIPEASVIVRDVSTRQAREISTNDEGVFRVEELPPGTYEVSVSQSAFPIALNC